MARKKKPRRRSYRRKARRRRRDNRIPLLTVLPPLHAAVLDPISNALPSIQSGDMMGGFQRFADRLSENFMGFYITQPQQGFIGWQRPMQTYTSIIAGAIASKLMNRLGVNRSLKKVPFLGKYIKL